MTDFRSLRLAAVVLAFVACVGAVAEDDEGGARVVPPNLWSPLMSRAEVQLGRVDADHDDGYLYCLPYGDDVSFPIIQAYGARLSHRAAQRRAVRESRSRREPRPRSAISLSSRRSATRALRCRG